MSFIRAVTSFHIASRNRRNCFWHSRDNFSLSCYMYLSQIQQHTCVVSCLPPLTGTSVLAGIAIFSILGHMAHIYRRPIEKVVKEGQIMTLDVRKKKHFMLTLCDIVSSLCRFRPCFYCISRGFNPSAHFPFMVRSVFYHACRHRSGLSVHSDR